MNNHLISQIGKIKPIEAEIVLGTILPIFIAPVYDLRPKVLDKPIYKCIVCKNDLEFLDKKKKDVEHQLLKIFEKVKKTIDIKEELTKTIYYISPKRKGEISNYIIEMMYYIDRTKNFFPSFGTGNTVNSVYKPIINYLDIIIDKLKPEYIELLDEWELLFHKCQATENISDF